MPETQPGAVSADHLASLVDADVRAGGRGVLVVLAQGQGRGRPCGGRCGGDERGLVVSVHDGELADVGGVSQGHGLRPALRGGQGGGHAAGHNVAVGDVGAVDVLVHVGVEAEDAAESRALQRRTEVTALLSRDEQLVLQQGGLADRGQDEVPAFQRGLVDVQLLAGFQHVVLAVGGPEVGQAAARDRSGRRGNRERDPRTARSTERAIVIMPGRR